MLDLLTDFESLERVLRLPAVLRVFRTHVLN